MIQLNLLPDVKLEYIKAERQRRLVIGLSAIITIIAIVLLVIMLSFSALQKKHLNALSDDIKTNTAKLQKQPDINRVLTVQNQLDSLTALHEAKPDASRLFTYLNQLTPPQVGIASFAIDFDEHTVTMNGTAEKLSNVHKYVDTLKAATYIVKGDKESTKAFSDVVLGSFGLSSTTTEASGKPANYTISLTFDELIFDNTQEIELKVDAPQQRQNDLFQSSAAGSGGN